MSAEISNQSGVGNKWILKSLLDSIINYESRSWKYIQKHPIYQYLPDSTIVKLHVFYRNNLRAALEKNLTVEEIEVTAKEFSSPLSTSYIKTCSQFTFKSLGDSKIHRLYKLERIISKRHSIGSLQTKKLRGWIRSRNPETSRKIQDIVRVNISRIRNSRRYSKQFDLLGLALAEQFDDKEIDQLHKNLLSPLGRKRQAIYAAVCSQTLQQLDQETLVLVGKVAMCFDSFNSYFRITHEDENRRAKRIIALFEVATDLNECKPDEIKSFIEKNPNFLKNLTQ